MSRNSGGSLMGFGTLARRSALGLLVLVVLGAAQAAPVQAGYSAIVIDASNGNVLYQRDPDARRYPASLTKMMTLYLVFEALEAGTITMDTEWTVSSRAAAQPPSKIGLPAGATIRVEDAIMALVTKSANDIASVVAEGMSGTEWEFAQRMTAKARALGMGNTIFANASGLPDASMVSTARDMATLSLRMQSDFPQYYPLFSTRSFSYRGQTYGNHNKLLGVVEGVDGIKTGFTNAAGWNLAASAMRGGRRVVVVLMGGQSRVWRDNRVTELMNEGYVIAMDLDTPAPLPGEHPLRGSDVMLAAAETGTVTTTVSMAPVADELTLASLDNMALESDEEPLAQAQGSVEDLPWGVQVGAFSQAENAHRALDAAAGLLAPVLGAQGSSVVTASDNSTSPLYRARFVNLSEAQAREGCKLLAAQQMSCQVVRYSAGS
jgi:D-alanyl-D-alanine carboxypeptidase